MPDALHLLVLEDRARDFELMLGELRHGGIECVPRRVETESEYRKQLVEFAPGLILADYSLPSYDGLSALALARQSCPDVPFIFVSGTMAEEIAIEALKQGATDYVLKHPLARLVPSVRRALLEAEERRQRCQAEEHLREAKDRLEALFQASPVPIILHDSKGAIRMWNPAAELTFGWRADQVVRQQAPYVAEDQREEFARLQQRVRDGETLRGIELAGCRSQAGPPVELLLSAAPLHGPEGTVHGTLAVLLDITENKKLEAHLLRAQRLESIGRLASGMAHDFNNMLAPLLMSLPALRLEAQSDEVRTLLAIIEASVQRGANMVRQVLTFARGALGPRGPVGAAVLVREMERIIRETFPRSIQLECVLPADPWPVLADSTQLHQVLLNLCVNARDAMPRGGQLRISAENVRLDEASARRVPDAKAGPYLVLAVSDTGTGIRAENLDRIFEPFFTTKAPDRGTGLGLSTALGIVKSHGGFVQVESKPGHGAQFRVYLPATQTPPQPQSDPASTRSPRGTGQLILLVDDEKGILLAGRRLLEHCGYRVLTASDGNQAIALFARRAREIDLVITDIVMPLLDGAAMVRRILKLDPKARIIVTSGDLTRFRSDRTTKLDSLRTLWKPFTADLLIQTVHAALAARRPATNPAPRRGPPAQGDGRRRQDRTAALVRHHAGAPESEHCR